MHHAFFFRRESVVLLLGKSIRGMDFPSICMLSLCTHACTLTQTHTPVTRQSNMNMSECCITACFEFGTVMTNTDIIVLCLAFIVIALLNDKSP